MSSALLIVPTLFLLDGSSSPSPLPAVAIAAADPSSASTSSPVDSGTAFAAATQASARAIWFEKAEVTDRARRFFNVVHLLAVAKADKEAAAAAQAVQAARQRHQQQVTAVAATVVTLPQGSSTPPTNFAGMSSVVQCIKNHESGNYSESSHPGEGSGAYQFIPGTWQTYDRLAGYPGGVYSLAYLAPPWVQDTVLAYALTHGGAHNWDPKYGNDPCTVGLP